MRLMRTDAPQPLDDDFDALCKAVGADDVYRELCREQDCFRARLTPKPLRCGIEMPTWSSYSGCLVSDEGELARYVNAYDILADHFKVCKLTQTIGGGIIHRDLRALVDLHDQMCKVSSDLPMESLHASETNGPTWMSVLAFHVAYRGEIVDGVFKSKCETPSDIWAVLSDDVRQALNDLDTPGACKRVQIDHQRYQDLCKKWDPEWRAYCDLRNAAVHARYQMDKAERAAERAELGLPPTSERPDNLDFFQTLAWESAQ
jgi:hypothetical protein